MTSEPCFVKACFKAFFIVLLSYIYLYYFLHSTRLRTWLVHSNLSQCYACYYKRKYIIEIEHFDVLSLLLANIVDWQRSNRGDTDSNVFKFTPTNSDWLKILVLYFVACFLLRPQNVNLILDFIFDVFLLEIKNIPTPISNILVNKMNVLRTSNWKKMLKNDWSPYHKKQPLATSIMNTVKMSWLYSGI